MERHLRRRLASPARLAHVPERDDGRLGLASACVVRSSVAAFSKGRMRSKQGSDFIDIREGGSVRFGSNDSSVAVRITQENGKPGHGSPTERTHSRRSKRSNETLSPRSLARRMSEYDVKEDSADDRRLKALINDAKKTRE